MGGSRQVVVRLVVGGSRQVVVRLVVGGDRQAVCGSRQVVVGWW